MAIGWAVEGEVVQVVSEVVAELISFAGKEEVGEEPGTAR